MVLSAEYERLYDEVLNSAAGQPSFRGKLAVFWPMCGAKFASSAPRLMVVGRAVNGWGNGIAAPVLLSPEGRSAATKQARAVSEVATGCPMSWVETRAGDPDYNTNRSAFWRVIRKAAASLHSWSTPHQGWSSVLCWTNLFKVSPHAGGNPSTVLRRSIIQGSVQLLRREVEEFSPDRVIVLTGLDWFLPFADGLGLTVSEGLPSRGRRVGPVEATANMHGRRWVIAKHPQGKPEQDAVSAILAALSKLYLDGA